MRVVASNRHDEKLALGVGGISDVAKVGRKTGLQPKPGASETSFDAPLGAKSLAEKLGGVRRARQALDMLRRLS